MFGFKKKKPVDWSTRPLRKFDIYFEPANPISVVGHEYYLVENNYQTFASNSEAPGNCWVYRDGQRIATFQRVLGVVVSEPA